jgi:hypothetical protein
MEVTMSREELIKDVVKLQQLHLDMNVMLLASMHMLDPLDEEIELVNTKIVALEDHNNRRRMYARL